MLVLSRFQGERLNFYLATPDGPKPLGSLRVLLSSRGIARLGFEMPSDVIVKRAEIDDFTARNESRCAGA